MVKEALLKLYWLHIQIVLHLSRRGATLKFNFKIILFLGLSKDEI